MYRPAFSLAALCLLGFPGACRAQFTERPALEIDTDVRTRVASAGPSSGGLYAGSVGFRSGIASGWRIDLYADRKSSPLLTYAFSRDLVLQRAMLVKEWNSDRVQVGIIRIPFGIYDHEETYASGLIDYPMPRGDYGENAVDWGVPGAMWSGGTTAFQVEAAGFSGRAAGVWENTNTVRGAALRAQTYMRGFILGASHWDGSLDQAVIPHDVADDRAPGYVLARRSVHENGLDLRFTRPHLLVRGEFLFGDLGGRQMCGWYIDAYYHLPKYEKLTFAARAEALRPGSAMAYGKQLTLGVRYTASADWILAVNWRRNNLNDAYPDSWTPFAGGAGDLYVQVYHKLRFGPGGR